MKVGDLVRHEMYSELKAPALVLAVDNSGTASMIKIFDPDDGGFTTWEFVREYEVISASR